MANETTFSRELLKIYDRKIMSGEITFFTSGIRKSDFTRFCTDPNYVPDREAFGRMEEGMHFSPEERETLIRLADWQD